MSNKTFVFVGNTEIGASISKLLVAGGFDAAPNLASANVVFTYTETQDAKEDLYFESEGLLQGTQENAVLVDLGPGTPNFARELYAVARVNDRLTLDAPLVVRNVAEKDAFGTKENLLAFVGGEEDAFNQVKDMLQVIAATVVYLGDAGCGQNAKMAATLQRSASLVGILEAYALHQTSEAALEFEEVIDALGVLGCVAPADLAYVNALCSQEFKGSYSVAVLLSELTAALLAAEESECVIPQAESGFRLIELLALVGGGNYNPAALGLLFAGEEAGKKAGLDWSRVEGLYDENPEGEHEHNCECGHEHSHGHGSECGCGHEHSHSNEYEDYSEYDEYNSEDSYYSSDDDDSDFPDVYNEYYAG